MVARRKARRSIIIYPSPLQKKKGEKGERKMSLPSALALRSTTFRPVQKGKTRQGERGKKKEKKRSISLVPNYPAAPMSDNGKGEGGGGKGECKSSLIPAAGHD